MPTSNKFLAFCTMLQQRTIVDLVINNLAGIRTLWMGMLLPKYICVTLYFTTILPSIIGNTFKQPFEPLTPKFLEKLDDPIHYNKYQIPTYHEGIPTNVSLSMYIEGISSFSAQSMDFALDIYFQQEWTDKRLQHNGTVPILIRDKAVLKKMWHPDVYFANARHASFQHITDDNFLVWLFPEGRIWYECRINMVVICAMDLRKYPLDSQVCSLRILSYAYPETQLNLVWSSRIIPAIDQNPDIRMPDMTLRRIENGDCNGTYATGVWSCKTAVFKVDRQMMHHIMQTYLPSGIIIIISWFNFWLDIDSAPARVSLSITVLLTISTQANAVKLALPEVSYLKAIDVWLGVCLGFAFGVMIEFTICHYAKNQEMHRGPPSTNHTILDSTMSTLFGVNSETLGLHRRIPHGRGNSCPYIDDESMSPEDGEKSIGGREAINAEARLRIPAELNPEAAIQLMLNGASSQEKLHQARMKPKQRSIRLNADMGKRALSWTRSLCNLRGRAVAVKIDEHSRIVFPMCFVAFNIVYWVYYLYVG
uniref:Ig-like domain-containing protein n=1 Tax=Panagrellus redivivus TaxID=6233 RepID=A0A7E4VYE7_PANRE